MDVGFKRSFIAIFVVFFAVWGVQGGGHYPFLPSDVPARLGLKAAALARLSTALAFRIFKPGQSRQ
jgi:hypothetical protein